MKKKGGKKNDFEFDIAQYSDQDYKEAITSIDGVAWNGDRVNVPAKAVGKSSELVNQLVTEFRRENQNQTTTVQRNYFLRGYLRKQLPKLQRQAVQERFEKSRAAVIKALECYVKCFYFCCFFTLGLYLKFHHHNKRASVLIKAIRKAKELDDIKSLLAGQLDLVVYKTREVSGVITRLRQGHNNNRTLDPRWSHAKSTTGEHIKHDIETVDSSGYAKTVLEAATIAAPAA